MFQRYWLSALEAVAVLEAAAQENGMQMAAFVDLVNATTIADEYSDYHRFAYHKQVGIDSLQDQNNALNKVVENVEVDPWLYYLVSHDQCPYGVPTDG